MTKIGDTFLFVNPDVDSHLHIIISDPTQDSSQLVTVNFTSWKYNKDQSCILNVGYHPYIKVRTCVDYRRDKLISLTDYERFMNAGFISPHKPVSEDLLRRILNGAEVSPHLPLGNHKILVDQGLIDTK